MNRAASLECELLLPEGTTVSDFEFSLERDGVTLEQPPALPIHCTYSQAFKPCVEPLGEIVDATTIRWPTLRGDEPVDIVARKGDQEVARVPNVSVHPTQKRVAQLDLRAAQR